MPATLSELVRGITGHVTREDAKRLAKLHGHPWRKVLKRMKGKFLGVDRSATPSRLLPKFLDGGGETVEEAIDRAIEQISRIGGTPDVAIVDGVEVRHGS